MSNHKSTLSPMSVHDMVWIEQVGVEEMKRARRREIRTFVSWCVVFFGSCLIWLGVGYWIIQMLRLLFR